MTNNIRSRFEGAMLGLALGDAYGAPFEGGPLERLLWRLIGKTREGKRRYTDDTQMALDLASSIVACGKLDQDDISSRFANSYRWSRGYGPGAAKILKRIRSGVDWRTANKSVHRDGSYGNGAAMRAPVIGLFCYQDSLSIDSAANQSAEITHAHPLGIDGARLVACAVAAALTCDTVSAVWQALIGLECDDAFKTQLELAREWEIDKASVDSGEIRRQLGNGISATKSVVTGIYIGLSCAEKSFADLLDLARQVGGDTDTIGAMAGAIWGAWRGADELPRNLLQGLEDEALIRQTAISLFETIDLNRKGK